MCAPHASARCNVTSTADQRGSIDITLHPSAAVCVVCFCSCGHAYRRDGCSPGAHRMGMCSKSSLGLQHSVMLPLQLYGVRKAFGSETCGTKYQVRNRSRAELLTSTCSVRPSTCRCQMQSRVHEELRVGLIGTEQWRRRLWQTRQR